MIRSIPTVNMWVGDIDEALAFYTEKVGLEVRTDVTVPELGNFRWVTVGVPGQPDVAFVLMPIPGPPMFDAATAATLGELVAKGAVGAFFLSTDDCRADYETLKARGVEFVMEPTQMPYGVDAAFRDPFGNQFRLVQEQMAG
jgi:predicted enzyme related to lactoylglutathione lyase